MILYQKKNEYKKIKQSKKELNIRTYNYVFESFSKLLIVFD